jgi:hypothetical protein
MLAVVDDLDQIQDEGLVKNVLARDATLSCAASYWNSKQSDVQGPAQ